MAIHRTLSIVCTVAGAVLAVSGVCADDAVAGIIGAPQPRSANSASVAQFRDAEIVVAQYQSAPRPSYQYPNSPPAVYAPREYVPSDPDVLFIAQNYSLIGVKQERDKWYRQFRNNQSATAYAQYQKFDQALKFKQEKCIEQERIRQTDLSYQSVYCR